MDVVVDGNDLLAMLQGHASSQAIDRLTREYNNAGRVLPPEYPTGGELDMLMKLFVVDDRLGDIVGNNVIPHEPRILPFVTVDPAFIRRERKLLSDGWIEFGVRKEERIWTSSGEQQHLQDPVPLCRLTGRGHHVVRDMLRTSMVIMGDAARRSMAGEGGAGGAEAQAALGGEIRQGL